MTATQADKAKQFRSLHEAPEAFVIANGWDGGSARMMAALGFPALATSSGASAGLLGRRDGQVTREEPWRRARMICGAIDLPVLAGLEKGLATHRKLWRKPSGSRRKPVWSAVRSRMQGGNPE